jgi:S1-C subfamily serine protease
MAAPLESSIVRFRKSNGAVVGAGFLVSEKHIVTCAHVVADALGIARDTQNRPTEDVYLDFPLVDSETQLTARVVFWSPVPPKGSTSVKGKEDIAGLELKSSVPEGVQPVGLVRVVTEEDLRGNPFHTFGFPSGHDDGLEATGVLRGRQSTGWVQLEDVKQTGVRLEPGFSGAPVWDEKLNGVVGMAVAADQKRPEAKVAFMIPTRVLVTAWKDLDKLIDPKNPSRFGVIAL